jgi:hypothetical protein
MARRTIEIKRAIIAEASKVAASVVVDVAKTIIGEVKEKVGDVVDHIKAKRASKK